MLRLDSHLRDTPAGIPAQRANRTTYLLQHWTIQFAPTSVAIAVPGSFSGQ
jgi:hypothetical protein